MSIRHQADLLSLNRSGLYYIPRGVSPEEVAMKHRIDELYTKWPFYGSRRITACLHREEVSIARKRVQRYMQEMGIGGSIQVQISANEPNRTESIRTC